MVSFTPGLTMLTLVINAGNVVFVNAGFIYPVCIFAIESILQRAVPSRVSSDSVAFSGVYALVLEVAACAPQFYVLTMCV